MLSQRIANLVFVSLVIVACGYFAWVAEGFVTSGLLASSGLPSKFFPQLTLAIAGCCAAIVGYLYFFRAETGDDKEQTVFANAGDARRGMLMLAVSVMCYFIWQTFGFIVMALILGPASLLAMGIRNPLTYVTVLALTAFVYVIFSQALGIHLV